MVSALSIF